MSLGDRMKMMSQTGFTVAADEAVNTKLKPQKASSGVRVVSR